MDTLTPALSKKYHQPTLLDTHNAISLQELADGVTPSTSPDGHEIGPSGLAVAPANRTRRRARGKATKTPATSGLTSTASSASVALTRYLVNRLMLQFDTVGSMEYVQTWKDRVTPSGRSYSEHTASARRISDSDCTGWSSPTASDDTGGKIPPGHANRARITKLKQCTNIVGWPTPLVNDSEGSTHAYGGPVKPDGSRLIALKLPGAVQQAGWPTPQVHQGPNNGENRGAEHGGARARVTPQNIPDLIAGWPTPMAGSPGTEEYNPAGNNDSSRKTVELVGWATPTTRDHKDGTDQSCQNVPVNKPLGREVHGVSPTGTNAETGKPVAYQTTKMRLNPFFSLYLMGFPVSWGLVGLASSIESKKG